ncbi:MAG: flagellin [Petrotoga sp.]|nr:flagellin [Petrotoga sp.]
MGKSLEKLSSGLRINRAGDDVAGLSNSEKMRAQIKGLDMAVKNAQDSISLIQTAEGALTETHSILQRMRELAIQAANDTNVTADREALQDEVEQLIAEVTRIANNTEFNTQKLLNGTFTNSTFHIGANIGQNITLSINTMNATALGINSINLESQASANAAISTINAAIEEVSTERSKLGAYQNRLEHTINNLQVASENLTAAESRIRDVDMAKEMMNYTKQQILLQSSNAMLAQANMVPQNVLQLLR